MKSDLADSRLRNIEVHVQTTSTLKTQLMHKSICQQFSRFSFLSEMLVPS